jgi:predicted amidohydrolase YtcJ
MAASVRFTGGRIFTGSRYAEALLFENGRIAAVGSAESVARSTPTGAEHVDLHGHLALPGLIDAHLHLPDLTEAREGLDVSEVRSLPQLLERLEAWARDHPVGPIVGRGWSADRLAERRSPTAVDLDRAVPDRPVFLKHASGHAAVANRAALELVGLDGPTPDPPGGRIGREPDGTPNGLVFENALRRFDPLNLLAFAREPEAAVRTLNALVALGLTGVATLNLPPEGIELMRRLDAAGVLPVRVWGYVSLARWREISDTALAAPPEGGRFRLLGGKAFLDGAFGPRTAWLSRPYADAPEESGIATVVEAELSEALDWCADHALAPALHAIGDRAVAAAAAKLRPFRTETGPWPRIEHASLVPPEVLPELERSRPALVVQPGFLWSDDWLGARLGSERARWAYPFRTLEDRGYLLVGSSDAPYDPVDPWRGIRAAVHRRDPEGRSANPIPQEALSEEEALRLYGAHAGLALGVPRLGTLEVGAPADLIVVRGPTVAAAIRDGVDGLRASWLAGRPSVGAVLTDAPQTL